MAILTITISLLGVTNIDNKASQIQLIPFPKIYKRYFLLHQNGISVTSFGVKFFLFENSIRKPAIDKWFKNVTCKFLRGWLFLSMGLNMSGLDKLALLRQPWRGSSGSIWEISFKVNERNSKFEGVYRPEADERVLVRVVVLHVEVGEQDHRRVRSLKHQEESIKVFRCLCSLSSHFQSIRSLCSSFTSIRQILFLLPKK